MPKKTLQDKINNFNRQYYVKFDPRAVVEGARIKAVFDAYKFDKEDEKTTQAKTYWKALTDTLEKSLTAQTEIRTGGLYDLSTFDIVKFVRGFEEIMDETNKSLSNPRKRMPFEGMKFDDMIKKIKAGTHNALPTFIKFTPP